MLFKNTSLNHVHMRLWTRLYGIHKFINNLQCIRENEVQTAILIQFLSEMNFTTIFGSHIQVYINNNKRILAFDENEPIVYKLYTLSTKHHQFTIIIMILKPLNNHVTKWIFQIQLYTLSTKHHQFTTD